MREGGWDEGDREGMKGTGRGVEREKRRGEGRGGIGDGTGGRMGEDRRRGRGEVGRTNGGERRDPHEKIIKSSTVINGSITAE